LPHLPQWRASVVKVTDRPSQFPVCGVVVHVFATHASHALHLFLQGGIGARGDPQPVRNDTTSSTSQTQR
jgi:hypothetical protein